MTKRKGFTLLELLVVVGIISLLLTLLFPALARAKMAVRRTVCLANMRGIVMAVRDYEAANNERLPPAGADGYPPFGAKNPMDASKYLNSALKSDNYRAIQCPADAGVSPTSEQNCFDTDGYSYWYACDNSAAGMGISQVVGPVTWPESTLRAVPTLSQAQVQNQWHYNDRGPEAYGSPSTVAGPDDKDANGGYLRVRDVTQGDIDGTIWPGVQTAMAKYPQHVDLNDDAFKFGVTLNTEWIDPSDHSKGRHKKAYNSDLQDSSTWDLGSMWCPVVRSINYWTSSSKKVVVMDQDAFLTGNTGGSNPRPMKGFWHDYPWTPGKSGNGNPLPTTDANYYNQAIVRVHAAFLDGHAEAIEVNKYTTIDRDAHDYY